MGQWAQATQLAANLAAHLRDDGVPPPGRTMATTWNSVPLHTIERKEKRSPAASCLKIVDQNLVVERVPSRGATAGEALLRRTCHNETVLHLRAALVVHRLP